MNSFLCLLKNFTVQSSDTRSFNFTSMMCDFFGIFKLKCLRVCTNGCFVLILLYVQTAHADHTSENSTIQVKQFKSTNQPSDADPQIPKSQGKCCSIDTWLLHLSLGRRIELWCVRLPPEIQHMSLISSWFATFSKFGIIKQFSLTESDRIKVWTKSNARNYRYFPENQTVFSLKTEKYYKIICSDYVNLDNDHFKLKNYNSDGVNQFENEITGHLLSYSPEEGLKEKIENFLSSFCTCISSFFLGLTFFLYISTPKLRQKVYDKCFLCQLAAFIVAFSFSIWRHQLRTERKPSEFCTFVGE